MLLKSVNYTDGFQSNLLTAQIMAVEWLLKLLFLGVSTDFRTHVEPLNGACGYGWRGLAILSLESVMGSWTAVMLKGCLFLLSLHWLVEVRDLSWRGIGFCSVCPDWLARWVRFYVAILVNSLLICCCCVHHLRLSLLDFLRECRCVHSSSKLKVDRSNARLRAVDLFRGM